MVIVSLLFSALLAVVINYFRFLSDLPRNRLIFCAAVLVMMTVSAKLTDTDYLYVAMFLFVIVCAFSFSVRGGLLGALVSIPVVMWSSHGFHWQQIAFLGVGYVLVGLISGVYWQIFRRESLRAFRAQNHLFRQAKDLSIVRSIGTALQSTLDIDRIIHIILTAMTAGHGLGFNRAMLFLLSDDGQYLQGKTAIGSLRAADVIDIWKSTSRDKLKLEDYIEHEDDAAEANKALIEHIRKIAIRSDSEHALAKVIEDRQPMILHSNDPKFRMEGWFDSLVDLGQVAIVPLVHKGEMLGIIMVDNHFSKQPIDNADLERLLPLANQAAMALQNAALYHKTQEMAITDGLTGLHNQRFFEEMLSTIYNSTRRTQMPLSMLVLDIDYFKNYNDRNGHLAGNELLIKLAAILKQSVRKEDLTFRFGGEEFIVLLSSTSKKDALNVAEKIRKRIEDTEFPFEEVQPNGQLTISIGVASFPEDKDRPRELFEAADQALYTAKRSGRNQVVGYKEGEPA